MQHRFDRSAGDDLAEVEDEGSIGELSSKSMGSVITTGRSVP
jgi:hypothetical protein